MSLQEPFLRVIDKLSNVKLIIDRLCTYGSLVIVFKVCGIIGISKIEFFKTERVKHSTNINKYKIHHSDKKIRKLLSL